MTLSTGSVCDLEKLRGALTSAGEPDAILIAIMEASGKRGKRLCA